MESDTRHSLTLRSLGVMVLAILAAGLALGEEPTDPEAEPPPDPPLLTLTDPVHEHRVHLRAGAPVLHLVFFATWCPPCRDELPALYDLVARWGDRGYRLVVVAVPARQSTARLREFLATESVEGELLFDEIGAGPAKYRITQLPLHVLLDASGEEVLRAPSLDHEIESAVERMMLEHARATGE
jgi:thiol-disulfide isomerase/thioredoxin